MTDILTRIKECQEAILKADSEERRRELVDHLRELQNELAKIWPPAKEEEQ
jgi:hypothetical protein